MKKQAVTRMVAAIRRIFDRRMVGGIVIGATVALSTLATAQSSGSGGWFSSLFSTGGASSGTTSSTMISQQDSVVAAAINDEATNCANGADGTVGGAIQTAVNVHSQLASATPAVETLFDANDSCFSGINNIFDLSFAIPSLASILSSAADAVTRYAQKKVCTAVNRTTGLVTSPINQAIGNINDLKGIANVNGMANSAISTGMSKIDPDLGKTYHPTVADGTYSVATQTFSTNQTTFSSNSGTTGTTTTVQPVTQTSTMQNSTTSTQAPRNTSWVNSIANMFN
jgi:hypothetical protein